MIDVVDKFNMVDMGGIDIVKSQGIAVDGLFNRLLNSIQQCRYSLLYNWYFAEISIVPSPVELVFDGEKVSINELITVTADDVVHISSLELNPPLETLEVSENGIYLPSGDFYGFSEVRVSVEIPDNPIIVRAAPAGSYSAYLQIMNGTTVFNPDWSVPFELGIAFMQTQSKNSPQVLFGPVSGFVSAPTFEIQPSSSSNAFWFGISNGSAQAYNSVITKNEYPIVNSVWNQLIMSYDGTTARVVVTRDGASVTKSKVLGFTPSSSKPAFQLGGINVSSSHYAQYVLFDMRGTYFKQNGNLIWGSERSN